MSNDVVDVVFIFLARKSQNDFQLLQRYKFFLQLSYPKLNHVNAMKLYDHSTLSVVVKLNGEMESAIDNEYFAEEYRRKLMMFKIK